METKGKKALIIGLARSGVGAANLLSMSGADVTVTDRKPEGELTDYTRQLSPSVKLCLGNYPKSLNGTDLIVVSPGVPLTIEPLARALEKGIKIMGELELAYQMIRSTFKNRSLKSPGFLAVTGTNGKSTTTMLLDLMIRKGGFKTLLGGNIGNALTEEILKMVGGRLPTVDYVVAEVSSFQLESIDEFRPAGATVLNITPDHLDRYHSLADYTDAKCRIFENQGKDDFLVLNADDPMTSEIAKRIGRQGGKGKEMPGIYYFSRKHQVKGAYVANGTVYFDLPDVPSSFVLHPSSFRIKGVHNLENAMAAAAMALLAGCPPSSVEGALHEFPGLEHRLEFVRELGGVKYINDSKGTNVGAVIKSLEGFLEPIVLIAGGRDKAGDFTALRPLIKEKVKALVLIGEASAKLRDALGDLTETVFASDLREAVMKAERSAGSGDVVLLSPACASFDMFMDFEDRGRQFKKIVAGLS
ncbi:MAG TPA: UDP-N-acetylmuramoyl-L-alanine--D-glutamate ligase [Thermodesulfovibrionales bacterium]|nr:UDP-N-acetylmuramoyl-L-alanine--D-glutamate ligase [Thermodesulfovibrionales bacterium]